MDRSSIVPMLVTLLLIEGPTLAFSIDICVRQLLSPQLTILIIILDIATIISLAFCVYTDPGILPQNVKNYQWNEQLLELPMRNHLMVFQHSYLVVGAWGLSVNQKYCIECHIYRPLRAIHCRQCNHCVQKYDHHCPWLGICIGKYNYYFFIIFLGVLNLMLLTLVGCSISILIIGVRQQWPILEYLFQLFVGIVALGFAIGLIRLLVYHIELIQNKLTTNEDLKDIYRPIKGKVPFSRCEKNHPPLMDLNSKLCRIDRSSINTDEHGNLHPSDHINKGKRYSTLVSQRQSVLNSLVQTSL